MDELKIRSESLPGRCEICHQSDLYDAASNFCSRCGNLSLAELQTEIKKPTPPHRDFRNGIVLGLQLHLIQIPMTFMTKFLSILFIGLSQLIYIIPAIIIKWRYGKPDAVKGLLLVGSITFLLNAACFGLVLFLFGGGV